MIDLSPPPHIVALITPECAKAMAAAILRARRSFGHFDRVVWSDRGQFVQVSAFLADGLEVAVGGERMPQ